MPSKEEALRDELVMLVADIREALTEGRSLLKDLKTERKAIEEFIDTGLEAQVRASAQAMLEEVKQLTLRQIDDGQQMIRKHFEDLYLYILGFSSKNVRKGRDNIDSVLETLTKHGERNFSLSQVPDTFRANVERRMK